MTTATWTPEANTKLIEYLNRDGYVIPAGLGTVDAACSIAAINLALTGKMTYDTPACMSKVIGDLMFIVQDVMPSRIQNLQTWRELLPLAAGTGREKEQERLDVVVDWLWETVLPSVQPVTKYSKEWALHGY